MGSSSYKLSTVSKATAEAQSQTQKPSSKPQSTVAKANYLASGPARPTHKTTHSLRVLANKAKTAINLKD